MEEFFQILNNIVESDRKKRKETQAKIGSNIENSTYSYRQSYSRKMEMKHKRTVEILRKRAWIAKMNVKARHRKRDSPLVKKFCLTSSRAAEVCRVDQEVLNTRLRFAKGS